MVHRLQAVGTQAGVVLSDGTSLPADRVLAATGARAPAWLKGSDLQLDMNGYVVVDGTYCSVSHRNVFAAGDVAARQDIAVARSGVHAVHAGPVLAANLLAALQGGAMQTYVPRRHSLYLLACGPRYAVASWGRWSAEGAWVWYWKDWIDRHFVLRFARDIQPPNRGV
jgi:NADH dehydrogenase FAD-containing subunit